MQSRARIVLLLVGLWIANIAAESGCTNGDNQVRDIYASASSVTSFSFPDPYGGLYDTGVTCMWNIYAPAGMVLSLTFPNGGSMSAWGADIYIFEGPGLGNGGDPIPVSITWPNLLLVNTEVHCATFGPFRTATDTAMIYFQSGDYASYGFVLEILAVPAEPSWRMGPCVGSLPSYCGDEIQCVTGSQICDACSGTSPAYCLECNTTMYDLTATGECLCRNRTSPTCCPSNMWQYQQTGRCYFCSPYCQTCDGYSERDCLTCPKGLYFRGAKWCDFCDSNCINCDVNTGNCLECRPGTYPSGGYYCNYCSGQCTNCTNSTVCHSCQAGYDLMSTSYCSRCSVDCKTCTGYGDNLCTSCMGGYYLSNNECVACPTNGGTYCNTCNSTQCLTCNSDAYLTKGSCRYCQYNADNCLECRRRPGSDNGNGAESAFCTKCATGYFLASDGTCNECGASPGCENCLSYGVCTSCQDGYFLVGPDDPSEIGGSCTPCPDSNWKTCGISSVGGALTAYSCKDHYWGFFGTCFPCPAHCHNCYNSFPCNDHNAVYCYDNCCDSGYGINRTIQQCEPCQQPHCAACDFNQTSCSSCMPGYYLSGISCLKCAMPHCDRCNAAGTCSACSPGYAIHSPNPNCTWDSNNECYGCRNTPACVPGVGCVSCPNGTIAGRDGAGYATCLACSYGCASCENSTITCTSCGQGYIYDPIAHLCLIGSTTYVPPASTTASLPPSTSTTSSSSAGTASSSSGTTSAGGSAGGSQASTNTAVGGGTVGSGTTAGSTAGTTGLSSGGGTTAGGSGGSAGSTGASSTKTGGASAGTGTATVGQGSAASNGALKTVTTNNKDNSDCSTGAAWGAGIALIILSIIGAIGLFVVMGRAKKEALMHGPFGDKGGRVTGCVVGFFVPFAAPCIYCMRVPKFFRAGFGIGATAVLAIIGIALMAAAGAVCTGGDKALFAIGCIIMLICPFLGAGAGAHLMRLTRHADAMGGDPAAKPGQPAAGNKELQTLAAAPEPASTPATAHAPSPSPQPAAAPASTNQA